MNTTTTKPNVTAQIFLDDNTPVTMYGNSSESTDQYEFWGRPISETMVGTEWLVAEDASGKILDVTPEQWDVMCEAADDAELECIED